MRVRQARGVSLSFAPFGAPAGCRRRTISRRQICTRIREMWTRPLVRMSDFSFQQPELELRGALEPHGTAAPPLSAHRFFPTVWARRCGPRSLRRAGLRRWAWRLVWAGCCWRACRGRRRKPIRWAWRSWPIQARTCTACAAHIMGRRGTPRSEGCLWCLLCPLFSPLLHDSDSAVRFVKN